MLSNLVLLDFDGVVLRNHKITELIQNNSTLYLSTKLNVSYSKSKQIQKKYLSIYGHTAMLESVTHNTSVYKCFQDYNDFVFNKTNMDVYLNMIAMSDIELMKNIIDIKQNSYDDYVLFSNAHLDWVSNVLNYAEIDMYQMFDGFYTNDNNCLKPYNSAYMPFDQSEKISFVDDNIINLKPVENKYGWNIFHYSNQHTVNDLLNYLENI